MSHRIEKLDLRSKKLHFCTVFEKIKNNKNTDREDCILFYATEFEAIYCFYVYRLRLD